ncbi:heavy metal-responsive transcriptional regulator [Myxosarcina sp. GI1(2024)]
MEREQIYWKIGELADRTGVSVGTLRYYSDLGLLHLAKRGENGYRYYNQDASKQVEFIKKAQALGFTLEEIGQILDVRDRGQLPCSLVQTLLSDKIEQLAIKIEQMVLFKAELEHYRSVWANNVNSSSDDEVCPLIASVSLS